MYYSYFIIRYTHLLRLDFFCLGVPACIGGGGGGGILDGSQARDGAAMLHGMLKTLIFICTRGMLRLHTKPAIAHLQMPNLVLKMLHQVHLPAHHLTRRHEAWRWSPHLSHHIHEMWRRRLHLQLTRHHDGRPARRTSLGPGVAGTGRGGAAGRGRAAHAAPHLLV